MSVFISEYIEGSSNNKAVELYNPTGAAIDLGAGNYTLEFFSNGNNVASTTINLTGTIAAGGTYIIADDNAVLAVTSVANLTPGNSFFNGNDAVVVKSNSAVVDVLGQVGFDPGVAWTGGGVSTHNQTLRRKSVVVSGDTNPNDAFDPSLEWDEFPQDTFGGLGSHSIDQADLAIAPTDAIKPEGDVGNIAFTFSVTRSGNTTAPVSVAYVVSGAAVDGTDFGGVLPTGIVNFVSGDTSEVITVNVLGDAVFESDEAFIVTLSGGSVGTNITGAIATGTIQNDDVSPSPVPTPTPAPTPLPPPSPAPVSNPVLGTITSDGAVVSITGPLQLSAIANTLIQDTLTLSNIGSAPLQLQGLTPQFTGTLPNGIAATDVLLLEPSTGTVAPGGSLTVRVTLRDDLLPADYSGTLAIATNDPANPSVTVPFTGIVTLPKATDVAPIYGAQLPSNTPIWTAGDDTIVGAETDGDGRQWLNGSLGDDLIFGNLERDVLTGGPGNDSLFGGRGDDFLRGAEGDDVLAGDRGKDTLQGNGGADQFVLASGFGSDVILDFEDGRDRLVLAGPLTFESLTLQTQGNSTQILGGTEVLATVIGVDSSLLASDDFGAFPTV
ncbi:MAG: lamin tail domain-containing protein [Cyanophyceae cyanobacterium]